MLNAARAPMELSIGGVYFPPLLFVAFLGVALAWCLTRIMNRFNLVRFVWHPPLFFLALSVICTGVLHFLFFPI